jgi:nitrogen fixation protein NifU and related proteins
MEPLGAKGAQDHVQAQKPSAPEFADHALHPRNARKVEGANGFAALTAHDGSATEIWLRVEDDLIRDASFWTEGCGTTIACGSVATEIIKGKSVNQAFQLTPQEIDAALGGLPGEGCTCAELVADTVKAALRDYLSFKSEPWRRKYSKS